MKVYNAAGLKEIVSNSGYHVSTLKSIEQCSNFERTHYFLTQVWESLYLQMLHIYLNGSGKTIPMDVSCILLSSIQEKKSHQHLMKRTKELVKDSYIDKAFKDFVDEMSIADQTWNFGSISSLGIVSLTLASIWLYAVVIGLYV